MKKFAHWGRKTLLALILAWGLLALFARLATPLLEHAHAPIEQWLSNQAGQPVRFERIRASWWGIGPRLRLEQVRIGTGVQALRLKSISLDLSHISLLQGRLLDALRLTLDGLQLHLVREPDRRIHLVGVRPITAQVGPLPLPRHLRLRHTRLRWEDRLRASTPLEIDELNLDLVRHGQALSLHGRLDSQSGKAQFSAHIVGFLGQTDWSGNSYLKVQGLDLKQILASYLTHRYSIDKGYLDLELWQRWAHAVEVTARGHFGLRQLAFSRQTAPPRRFKADNVSGDIDYQRHPDGEWRILIDDLILPSGSTPSGKHANMAIRRHASGQDSLYDIGARQLPLDLLRQLALTLPLDDRLAETLEGTEPGGLVQQLRLSLSAGHPDRWTLHTRLQGLSIRPWQSIPGIDALDVQLTATPSLANIQIDTTGATLDYRQLFREPHRIRRLGGKLYWQDKGDGWTLFSDGLALESPDLSARAWFEYRQDNKNPATLTLRGQLHDARAVATGRFLPTAIMGDELVAWLDQAFSRGQVERADILIDGPLAGFPYDRSHDGTFEVVGLVHDTSLDYRKGWPSLQDVSARLFFHQNSLDIDLLKGRIFDSQITSAHARIDSLEPTSTLHIQGRLKGPLKDELQLLREPALEKDFGPIANSLQASGNTTLQLNFQVPLSRDRGEYRLDGKLHLHDNRLALTDWDLSIDHIRGELQITLDAVRASRIQGQVLGSPMQVDIVPTDTHTRIRARAKWPLEALQKRFPQFPLQLARGSSEFDVAVDIPNAHAPPGIESSMEVASNLKGVALDLPAPFGKAPEETRKLAIHIPLSGKDQSIHIRFADQFDALFSHDGTRGELRYARGKSQLPPSRGYRVLATLPRVDLSQWAALLAKLDKGQAQAPWQLDLATPMVTLDTLEFPDVRVKADYNHATLDADIQSPKIAGQLHYRDRAGGQLRADLDRLHLAMDTRNGHTQAVPDPAAGPDPRKLPAITLYCKDLRINKAALGKLKLNMHPASQGSRIQPLTIEGPSGRLQAAGKWLWQSGASHTYLNGQLQLPDLGRVLSGLGYPRQMRDAKTRLEFVLDWPGHPGQVHRATLHGEVALNITDGRLSEVDPGISRILGLLSLDALKRRLKFDFGDLLKKGYSFDSITGHYQLKDGRASTHDLVVDGPSGRIEIGGELGLVERNFNQVVQVTPKLDATLVIASTIAGGPVAGAATFLAQRLLSDEVDKLNRFEYSITGSWDHPKITPLKSGGAVSRVLNTLSGDKSKAKTKAQEEAIDENKTRPKQGLLEKLFGKPGRPDDKQQPETGLPEIQ